MEPRKSPVNVKHIGLIGPVIPFRGGISQYTTQLLRAMRKRFNVDSYSFSRLYPSVLFPGSSQCEYPAANKKEPGVHYTIDVLNFLTWVTTARKLQKSRVELVVIPWWTVFHFPWTMTVIWLLKRSNIPVLLLCHNIADHENRKKSTVIFRLLIVRTHLFLVNCSEYEETIRKYNPGAIVKWFPHPVFDQYPDPLKMMEPRASLELLFFGFIRPYKGLEVLADALQMLKGEDFHLSVVGEWWYKAPDLRKRLTDDRRVELVDRFVRDDEVSGYFLRADAVILPYHQTSGSGVAAIAMHYRKPVVVPRFSNMVEMIDKQILWGILYEPDNSSDLAMAIRNLPSFLAENEYPGNKTELNWDSLAECIVSILEQSSIAEKK